MSDCISADQGFTPRTVHSRIPITAVQCMTIYLFFLIEVLPPFFSVPQFPHEGTGPMWAWNRVGDRGYFEDRMISQTRYHCDRCRV
ncbi:hypothetical protein BDQ94DRAFT_139889 [Aspergillus welwitschiae]|uniref:Uncharacterized protein n=2 Tax=Aspergillus subgen. Circumdati TaxID=2720871 RepID=A0A3F3Q8U6_9EURO|nr:hypothetical protein BDQ94DRAFT_139889 [Aspergillus welwitschiae]RDH18066.1 hypothetical protein M747DRAFT_81362 [Aspergillus niger ATCC 13496]RDH35608.1 hypothetical protein BDQ94DRAFT_139889 [Aspergillus welwitschiae]